MCRRVAETGHAERKKKPRGRQSLGARVVVHVLSCDHCVPSLPGLWIAFQASFGVIFSAWPSQNNAFTPSVFIAAAFFKPGLACRKSTVMYGVATNAGLSNGWNCVVASHLAAPVAMMSHCPSAISRRSEPLRPHTLCLM